MAQSSKFLVRFYILLGCLGFVFTWYHALFYLGDGFLEANRLFWIDGLINANPAGKFLAADVLILALACNFFMFVEGRRLKIRYLYLYILAGLTIAISAAVPAFLAAREAAIDSRQSAEQSDKEYELRRYDRVTLVFLTFVTLAACALLF